MVADAHGDPGGVQVLPDVVRVHVTELERDEPEAVAGGAVSPADVALLEAALSALTRADPATAEAALACHIGLLAIALTRTGPGPRADGAPARDLAARFTDLAANELGRGRTLGELAAALGVTAGQLDRACREATGRSALELTYRLRVERAVALLRDGRPPARVAAELGFTGLAHLSRVLMEATGRGPEAFRQGRA